MLKNEIYSSSATVVCLPVYNRNYGWCHYEMSGQIGGHAVAAVLGKTLAVNPLLTEKGNLSKFALTRAYAKVNEPEIAGLVYLGELRETISMLRRPLSGLRKGLMHMTKRALRKPNGKRKTLKHAVDALSDTWLEYRYGLMPLVYQADEVAKYLAERMLKSKKVRYARGGVKLEEKTEHRIKTAIRKATVYVDVTDYDEVGAYATVGYVLPAQKEAQILGFVGTEILPTAWELTTLSFVADWFANLGSFISAIQPSYLTNILWNTVSNIHRFERQAVITGAVDTYGHPCFIKHDEQSAFNINGELDYLFRSSHLKRVVGSEQPVSPAINPRLLGVNQELDLLALTWGRFPKFLKSGASLFRGKH
jgi:hypothetical protein